MFLQINAGFGFLWYCKVKTILANVHLTDFQREILVRFLVGLCPQISYFSKNNLFKL